MPTVTASIEIDAPPEMVWAGLADPNDYVEIAEPTQRMLEVSEVPIREGSTYKEYGGIAPFFGESEWTVTEFRPHEFQRHVGDEPTMHYVLDCRFESLDGGARTRFTQDLALKPAWFLAPVNALLWPIMMRKRAQAAMDGTVANLKRLVEAR